VLLLKFLTNRFKSIGSSLRKSKEVSFTNSTVLLAFTELLMVVAWNFISTCILIDGIPLLKTLKNNLRLHLE
jgi:hypothetical protein